MSYYFPFRGADAITKENIDYSLSTVTASVPSSPTITAITASWAVKSEITPPAGNNGTSVTEFACIQASQANPALLVSGSAGSQGPTGIKGTDVLTCPEGTVRCMALEVSLSAQFISGTGQRGVNYFQSSGSQFSIVCMQVPTTCSSAQAEAGCPEYLRITSPTIP